VSSKGYELAGSSAQVLAFHGYTGSPYDLRPLANGLNEHDVKIHVPLLLGHGSKPQDLFDIDAQDWLRQAKDELKKLDPKKPIVLAGLSMGALLAILLAGKSKKVSALILISPALRLNLSAELAISAAQLGLLSPKNSIQKMGGKSDINDPVAREMCPSYGVMPIHGLLQFEHLRLLAKKALPRIKCPLFMAFAKTDGAINTGSSRNLILALAPTKIVSKTYSNSKHVLPLDFDRDTLCRDVWMFLKQTLHL